MSPRYRQPDRRCPHCGGPKFIKTEGGSAHECDCDQAICSICEGRRLREIAGESVKCVCSGGPGLTDREFPPETRARADSRETSRKAAEVGSVNLNANQWQVYYALVALGSAIHQAIVARIRERGHTQSSSGIRTRTAELVEIGLVRDTGRTAKTEAGFDSTVWAAVSMTAFEVGIRKEDDLTIVSPQVTPLQKETLDPLLTRSLALLMKAKRIEEPPQTFDFDIAYQGRLSLAMASVQSNAMEATLAKWQPYAEVSPVYENLDWDEGFRKSWLAAGAPADVLVDFDEMIKARKKDKELQEAAAQAEIAETASKAYKKVETVPEEGSLAAGLV